MSDSEITVSSTPADQQSMEVKMETPQESSQNDSQQEQKKQNISNLTLRIWPPSQRTRDAVIKRLIETLTTPSVLSKRYGSMPGDDATSAARTIEEEAFSVADKASSDDDDGIEILQVYSKEISKRMLEMVKSRSTTDGSGSATAGEGDNSGVGPTGGANEEALSSTVEAEA